MTSLNQIESLHNTATVETERLSWGRSYLMCPPRYFGVEYEINPWMNREQQVDIAQAYWQWQNLVANIGKAKGRVMTIAPVEKLPDMVFTANAGVVVGERFVVSKFRHTERQPESKHDAAWFAEKGYEVIELPLADDVYFEGCGDVFPTTNGLIAGYGFRTDFEAHKALAHALDTEVHSIRLIDPRFYHLDLSFCPIDSQRAIIAPDAWDAASYETVKKLYPQTLELDLNEALTFCANSIVVHKTVIMPACPPRIENILKVWGYKVCISPVSEFLKAGGGIRCLTLALDVDL